MSLPREWWTDARHYQIAALSTLLAFNLGWLDFGARPLNSALAIAGALVTQALCTRFYELPSFDPRSPETNTSQRPSGESAGRDSLAAVFSAPPRGSGVSHTA